MHAIPLAVAESQVTPGVVGFLIVAAMGVALFFLIKSMNKQFHKIDFEESAEPAAYPRARSRAPRTVSTPAPDSSRPDSSGEEGD